MKKGESVSMRKYGKRCLCFLLAMAMVLSNVSVGSVAYASELETVDSAKESEKDSTSSDVPEEETEADAEESENEDDDKSGLYGAIFAHEVKRAGTIRCARKSG